MMARYFITLALLAACAGCGKKAPPAPPPPTVSVAQPLQRDVVDWDEYIGRFQAPQSVTLRARVTGVVSRILFRDGQDVRAGDALFVIDPRPYQAQLAQAEAQIAASQAALTNAASVQARSAQLFRAQAVSREELENDQAQVRTQTANLKAARATATLARLNLGFTTVRAPVSGRVSSRRVSLGDQVTAGDTVLTTIVSLDPIWFAFDGAESFYLKYLREAQRGTRGSSRTASNPVDIQLADETGYSHHGRMAFVDNALDPNSGTIQAHAVVPNPDHFLTPGMFGRARLLGSGTYRAMLVPDEAIVTDQSRKLVWVLGRDGKPVQRVVELGPEVMGLRAIRDGLAPADLVVLDGIGALQPGATVTARRTSIKVRSGDAGPPPTSVTAPQSTAATFTDRAR
ncbi:efflux RND transporter periplasmic adaptor subunit [Sphingomonas crusticola]|uniref:efflux RND transporter periplasmic adaptor subunit n=1 Tax=Sphingomonas crusticola TaxID=1697973 RepID=UPI001F07FF65|nr:efflux RND transporter periplasmic adaptor subunit [Sphingomonas crusticola]